MSLGASEKERTTQKQNFHVHIHIPLIFFILPFICTRDVAYCSRRSILIKIGKLKAPKNKILQLESSRCADSNHYKSPQFFVFTIKGDELGFVNLYL